MVKRHCNRYLLPGSVVFRNSANDQLAAAAVQRKCDVTGRAIAFAGSVSMGRRRAVGGSGRLEFRSGKSTESQDRDDQNCH